MELYSKGKNYKLYLGDMLDMLDTIEENTIDVIVTDPPYELNFMGKSWDNAGVSFNKETWERCIKVLKPGGHLLAFGGTRTYHRIACAIEDAGFEIRDCIMWLYGSGFPKSMNIGLAIDKRNGVESKVVGIGKSGSSDTHTRTMNSETKDGKSVFGGEYEIKQAQNEWVGWGTCLKPAYEPIIIARKPFKGSLVDNVIENGVGGLNIDECRVGNEKVETTQGRFPANVIHDGSEEVCSGFPITGQSNNTDIPYMYNKEYNNDKIFSNIGNKPKSPSNYNDEGSAARYFYCAKASKKDRDEGLEEFEEKQVRVLNATNPEKLEKDDVSKRFIITKRNIHPTVKPTSLMQYLVRLVAPKGATILDPFNGSGSTGKAVMYENKERDADYKYIGIELTEEYLSISKARLDFVCGSIEQTDITDTTNTPKEEIWNQIKNVLDIKE